MKWLVTGFGILLFACAGALAGAPSATAASDYDSYVTTTDSIYVGGQYVPESNDCSLEDVTYNWYGYMTSPDMWFLNSTTEQQRTDFVSAFDANLAEGSGWSVQQVMVGGEYRVLVQIFPPSATLTFTEWGGLDVGTTSSVEKFYFWHNSNMGCRLQSEYTTYNARYINLLDGDMLFVNGNITYPVGYEGENLPDSVAEPAQEMTQAPNWYLSGINNFEVSLHDQNFNTFDGNPFLCDDEFAPVLHWEITDDTTAIIFSGTQSATAQITRTMPDSDDNEVYTITGYYECEGYNFTETSSYSFEITKHGTLFVDLFDDCVSEEFPFIHPNNCLENIYTVINMTSDPDGLNFSYTTGCRELYVVHEWLHRDDPTLCPLFPENIRNTITPFISVTLGLITIGVIARLRSSE